MLRVRRVRTEGGRDGLTERESERDREREREIEIEREREGGRDAEILGKYT